MKQRAMKQHKRLNSNLQMLLRQGAKTTHGRIVLCGLIVVLGYVSLRVASVLYHSLNGSVGILMLAAVGLGLWELWRQRHSLQQVAAVEEDRLIGHILILSGVGICPFFLTDIWTQSFLCFLILAGIACSCWGASFFKTYPLPVFLIVMGLFPQPTIASRAIWEALTPPLMLERSMAWAGGLGLQLIGYPATVTNQFIMTPTGAVEVAWGCNGFYMAATMAVASLLLGLFMKQSRSKIILMILIGMVLALAFNIPRVMLMTIAAVYWGKDWFEFWHGSWGGQIFVSVLFTIYYYIAMGLFKKRSGRLPG